MLTEICQEIKNWFVYDDSDKHLDTFTIQDGAITPSFDLTEGTYYRVIGSRFNDGVYQYGVDVLTDETFDGALWIMSLPPSFLTLVDKIEAWQESNGATLSSPFTSESFGGYSYSKQTTSDGSAYSWRNAFKSDLNRWRKI